MTSLSTWPTVQMINAQSLSQDKTLMTKALQHKHMLEFIDRFKWQNLPPELTQDLIERILFFRFKGAFFKFNDKYWFLPFTLNGTIDSYGRYESIKPVLFTGQFDTKIGKWDESAFLPVAASNSKLTVAYGKMLTKPDNFEPAIILTDSSLEISQDVTAPSDSVGPFIEQLTDVLVLVNTDLISSAKVYTLVAKDPAQKAAIEKEFENLDARILNGKRVIVVLGDMASGDLQELKGTGQAKDSARYFQSYSSFDNLRKELIGVPNGGQFLKQEHSTEAETSLSQSSGSLVLDNSLRQRKEFCDLVNYYYGLNISVDINEIEESSIVEEPGAQTKQLEGDEK